MTSQEETGLFALVLLLRLHGVAAEEEQLCHRLGTRCVGITEMLRCAKGFGLKARAIKTNWARLARTPLPAIAALNDGGFLLLGRAQDDEVFVQRPSESRPRKLARAEFETLWDGRLVLMARRASLSDLSRRFDITWFLGAIRKYRRLLGEVLVASFFLQVFALVSPLFFQVIIDKVLVHRGMSTLAVLVIGLAVIAVYSPVLTLIVLGAFPFYIGISAVATPLFRRRLDEKFRRGAENQAFLVESVTGVQTLKALAVEPQMNRRWEEQLAGYVSASFRVISLGNVTSQAVQLVNHLVTVAILFLGAKLVIEGGLTVGELVAFNMLANRVGMPVLRIAQIWQDFHQARLSIERLGDILNTRPEPTIGVGRAVLPPIRGAVTFDHVGFRYRADGPEILHDVSFHVPAGQVVGIVGPSGSGKSTLARLLERLYLPETGRVLVDGIDLAMTDAAWLRRQVGIVLQEDVLFNRSVAE